MKLTLREWRRLKEVSQEEMAKVCDVHVNTYRTWEEKPSMIKLTDARIIAEKLEISLDDIIFMP